MEAFAGFLSHTDAQIGRVLAGLDELGVADNTLVMLLSDNGASAEGGPTGLLNEHRFLGDGREDPAEQLSRIDDIGGFRAYNHYPWGWAWAGNTPFKLWKRYAWLGGVRTPAGHPLARPHRRSGRRCAASSPTPSTSPPPCSRPWASRRPPPSTG